MPIPSYATPSGRNVEWSRNARVRIELTVPDSQPSFTLYQDSWVVLEYTDDSIVWAPVRGCDQLRYPTNSAGLLTVYDYEAPPSRVRQYRATTVVLLTNGDTLVSDASLTVMTVLHLRSVWIKDVLEPSINFTVPVDPKWQDIAPTQPRRAVKPLGRTRPIVMGEEGSYDSFPLQFTCVGDDNWYRIQALLRADRTFLIQTPKRQWYMQVSDNPTISEDMFTVGEEPARIVTVPLTEVEPI